MNRPALTSRTSRRTGAFIIGVLTFGLHVTLGNELGRTGVLHEWDVLYSADPTVYVTSFTTGQNTYRWGGRSFVHPNISNLIAPVVQTVAAAVHRVRPAVPEAIAARRVAYLICPLASGVTAGVLFLMALELGLTLGGAVLLVLLYVVSFSAVVFGSIPESYCLSAMALAILFRTAVRTLRDRASSAAWWAEWVVVGTLMASITISNLVSFALVALTVRVRDRGIGRAIVWTGAVSATALVITVGLYALGAGLVGQAPSFTPQATGQMEEWHAFDPHTAFVEFPLAMANAFAPPVPVKGAADPVLHQEMQFTLTYHAPAVAMHGALWHAVALLVALVIALSVTRSLPGDHQAVIVAAALVVVFNWVLHTFYGSEMFLYSQHWTIPLVVIFSALAAGGASAVVARSVLGALVVFCLINSAVVWRAAVRFLQLSQPAEAGEVTLPPRAPPGR